MIHRKMWNSASLKFCPVSVMFDQATEWKNKTTKTLITRYTSTNSLQYKGPTVCDHLWWGKWLTYQSVLPIRAVLLLTWCSGTLSKYCLTGSNWYGCILVSDSDTLRPSIGFIFRAWAGHFAVTPQSGVVHTFAHDFGIMVTLWVWQKMPFFLNAFITLRSQFHLHHHSQQTLTEIVSKITPNLGLVL